MIGPFGRNQPYPSAYFGLISSIGTRENSPEIVVIEINEDAQSCSMGPVCDLLEGEAGLFSLI